MVVLKLAGVFSVLYFTDSSACRKFLTLVLPKLPVMPMTVRSSCAARMRRASFTQWFAIAFSSGVKRKFATPVHSQMTVEKRPRNPTERGADRKKHGTAQRRNSTVCKNSTRQTRAVYTSGFFAFFGRFRSAVSSSTPAAVAYSAISGTRPFIQMAGIHKNGSR